MSSDHPSRMGHPRESSTAPGAPQCAFHLHSDTLDAIVIAAAIRQVFDERRIGIRAAD